MSINEVHYEFKLMKDRVDSLSNQDFNPAEIDWFVKKAQLKFIEHRMAPYSNRRAQGFEASQKRIDDLSTLVIKYPLQPAIIPTLDNGVYEVPLSSLAFPYLHLVSAYADVTVATDCTKEVLLHFIQHDDIREALRDPFNSPSLEFLPYNFGRSSSSSSQSSIYIYPGTLVIPAVYLEYVRYPKSPSLGNYTYLDGTTTTPQDLELPPHTHSEIVSLAVMIASLAVEDPQSVQFKAQDLALSE